jgi:tRNA pseudouridine55 synthase
MARGEAPEAIAMNGLLLIDKPQGITSHDVVARVRRATGESSIGHLGTLDPMATGLLPLLLGKWTRLARFYGSLAKTYTGVIRFGYATDTFDAEGEATGEPKAPTLTLDQLRAMAHGMLGESEQVPPVYSAKKIDGKPAYARARAGETPVMKPVRVAIDAFAIKSLQPSTGCSVPLADAAFELTISSGGYVRSVAHALGLQAGCGAHLAGLRRVAAGPLRIESALTLEEVESMAKAGELETSMPHPRTMLPELPSVTVDAGTLARMRNGMQIALPEFTGAPVVKVFAAQREMAGVAERVAGVLFQPSVVFSAG